MNYFTILTDSGIAAITAARASQSELKLTKMAVGDSEITPTQNMTGLGNEKHRFAISRLIQDPDNPGYLILEGVIPSLVGGFFIAEVAIYTEDNILFAIGNLPKTYKPFLAEGSAKDLTIKMIIEVANADTVNLVVDDSVVLATRAFVESVAEDYLLISDAISREDLDNAILNMNNAVDTTINGIEQSLSTKLSEVDVALEEALENVATAEDLDVLEEAVSKQSVIAAPLLVSPANNTIDYLGNIVSAGMAPSDNYRGVLDYTHWQLSTVADFSTLVDEKSDVATLIYTPVGLLPYTKYYVRVKHGSDGHLSDWSGVLSFTTANAGIIEPIIISPTEGETITGNSTTIVGSPYQTFSNSEAHLSTDWEVSTDIDFTNIVKSSYNNTVNKTSWNVSGLAINSEFFIRMRYKSASYSSIYSFPVKIITPDVYVSAPVLTVAGSPDSVLLSPLLTGSAFNVVNGSDTHASTDWQVLKASDNSVVWESMGDTVNKLSITVGVVLDIETEYKFRVRYNGSLFSSNFTEKVETTVGIYIETPTLEVEGAPYDVRKAPTLTTGAFSVANGSDTHASTDWQVLDASDNSVVWQSLDNAVNLLSIKMPEGFLVESTEYIFRARHNSDTYGSSGYNTVNAVTSDTFLYKGILAVHNGGNPTITLYGQDADNLVKLPDPSVLPGGPSGTGHSVAFSPDNNYLAVAHVNSPFITIYKRNGDTFTKLANPAALPASIGHSVAFSPDGNYLAVGHDGTPFITIYKRNGDTFTKLANPAALPASTGYSVAFSPDGNYLAVGHDGTPFITIYKRNGDTFTKLANPATLPTSTGYSVAFSPDSNYLAVAHAGSPFITIYKRNGDTFVKLANPAALPTSHGYSVAFSPDGNYLAVGHIATPYITIYKRNGDTFTKLANPAALPASTGLSVAFSPDSNYLAVAHHTTPYITIYKRNGDTFTKLANPAALPTSHGYSVAFSPDGN